MFLTSSFGRCVIGTIARTQAARRFCHARSTVPDITLPNVESRLIQGHVLTAPLTVLDYETRSYVQAYAHSPLPHPSGLVSHIDPHLCARMRLVSRHVQSDVGMEGTPEAARPCSTGLIRR